MKELFSKKAKKIITAVSLSCFLCSPMSYVFSMEQASAASLDTNIAYENQLSISGFDRDDHWDRGRSDRDKDWKNPPPPPPKDRDDDRWHDRDRHDDDRWEDEDDDKDFDRGDVTAAVLIGGVIGAIIAKNT